jgi:hypothetical protein
MILLTALLLWLSLRSLSVVEGQSKSDFLWETWNKSNKWYLLAMALIAMLSHLLRAYRWQMLLKPTGHTISLGSSFLSLMIGYMVNLAIPRGGEVSRCYNLFKLENAPVEISFGTVVAERVVDVICLLTLVTLSFFVEWEKLSEFIETLGIFTTGGLQLPSWVLIAFSALLGLLLLLYLFRKNEKFKKVVQGFRRGLVAVFRIEKKFSFVVLSIVIWVLYFIMTYFVIKAFPETSQLGFSAVLTLFAIGSIAMAAPLPGGAGSYHTLVPLGLVMLYQLPKADAVAFVFIFHGWQTFIMIVGGIVSLIISYWLIKWKAPKTK